ncbi:MAG: hypothetical protein R3D57_00230 [Hyphomicrobiaceae bacterium]
MVRSIGRVIWVALALVIAVLAGAVVLGFVGLERFTAAMHDAEPSSPLNQWMDLADVLLRVTEWGAALSILPAVVAVVIGELARIRSLVYWVAAGGVAAVAMPILHGLAAPDPSLAVPATALMQILATAGFAAGIVYWALAGRSS